uniref:Transforming growth factor beta-1-induced transcript 1 protein n=1 Tax=Lygus hesperus TaxID=30085 RepID=A0A0A9Y9F0_LYGHE
MVSSEQELPYYATVASDWDAVDNTEMSVKEGEVVLIRQINDRGWALAEKKNISGWVPSDYLDKLSDSKEDQELLSKALAEMSVNEIDAKPVPLSLGDENQQHQRICSTCQKPIEAESSLIAKGKAYHPGCFTCTVCHTSLTGVGFLEKDGDVYCERDYYAKFNPRCKQCDEVIIGGYITALGNNYHLDHFLCTTCQQPLVGAQYRKKDQQAYCEDCFRKQFGSKCYRCGEYIDDKVFIA